MWNYFSNLWGEFFLADSGGKCLRDLFFNYISTESIENKQKRICKIPFKCGLTEKNSFKQTAPIQSVKVCRTNIIIIIVWIHYNTTIHQSKHLSRNAFIDIQGLGWNLYWKIKIITSYLLINKSTNSEKSFKNGANIPP